MSREMLSQDDGFLTWFADNQTAAGFLFVVYVGIFWLITGISVDYKKQTSEEPKHFWDKHPYVFATILFFSIPFVIAFVVGVAYGYREWRKEKLKRGNGSRVRQSHKGKMNYPIA